MKQLKSILAIIIAMLTITSISYGVTCESSNDNACWTNASNISTWAYGNITAGNAVIVVVQWTKTGATSMASLASAPTDASGTLSFSYVTGITGLTSGSYGNRMEIWAARASQNVYNVNISAVLPISATTANIGWFSLTGVGTPFINASSTYAGTYFYPGWSVNVTTAADHSWILAFASNWNSYNDSPLWAATGYTGLTDNMGVTAELGTSEVAYANTTVSPYFRQLYDSTGGNANMLIALSLNPGDHVGKPYALNIGANNVTVSVKVYNTSNTYTYQYQRAPDNSGSPGTWANIGPNTSNPTYNDTGLTEQTTYWYRVNATDQNSVTTTSSAVKVITVSNVPSY